MDKTFKKYIYVSLVLVMIIAVCAVFVIVMQNNFSLYFLLLKILIVFLVLILLFLFLGLTSTIYAFKKKRVSKGLSVFLKFILVFYMPVILFLSERIFVNKDEVMEFYVFINNIIVESDNKKYLPKDIIIILPHCIQNSKCEKKITNDIQNCKRCGECQIEQVLEISEEFGVNVFVATGGTAARNVIYKNRPAFILSVACERDLSSGIADVKGIPVIGIFNERINGPCIDTRLDVELLRKKLEKAIHKEG